jgi:hypothetical protein
MSVNLENVKVFSFKSWVEAEPANEALPYKLHVHGEIQVADEHLFYGLDTRAIQGYFPEELLLEVKPDPVGGDHKVEIKFHQGLKDGNTYNKVTIYANNEVISEINIDQKS